MHKMLNVNDYFQVAMRSGKMHSECGGPDSGTRPVADIWCLELRNTKLPFTANRKLIAKANTTMVCRLPLNGISSSWTTYSTNADLPTSNSRLNAYAGHCLEVVQRRRTRNLMLA